MAIDPIPAARKLSGSHIRKPHWGWRVYFYIEAGQFALVNAMVLGAGVIVLDLVNIPIGLVGLGGLYGYAFGRQVAPPYVWAVWWKLQAIWDGLLAFMLLPMMQRLDVDVGDVAWNLLFLATRLPLYAGLFRYSRRDLHVRDEATAE